jgi:hypothetical protein
MGKLCLSDTSASKKNVISFIANFICAVIAVRSVNWVEIAQAMEGKALPESKYKQIQRYFRCLSIPESQWVDFVLSCFPRAQYRLSLDRTNWQIGQKKVNFLVLAVVLEHTSIPVYWKLLPKKGNSHSRERIEMLAKFVSHPGGERIDYLTADREFGSREFVAYLLKSSIRFCLRVRNDSLIGTADPKEIGIPAREYLKRMAFKQRRVLEGGYIWGLPVSIALRREKNDSVVVITNFDAHRALKRYRKRWTIEQLFQNLKSRGFNLEATHVTDLKRLHTLMGVLTLAYAWCYGTGEWLHQKKSIPVKKHQRLAKSLFRAGLDLWRIAIFHFSTHPHRLIELVKQFIDRLRLSGQITPLPRVVITEVS